MPSRQQLAHAIRALSMDAVQRANSGHPGMPMGMADIAEVLWNDFLKHNPNNPDWINRDRFILSNGHGSMLQYALLHLTGYELTIDDLKSFRQLHSKTPGHPEYHCAPGIETTTGPLGQGLANGVGVAIAECLLASHFNRPDFPMIDHYTYVFAGDGCLMEGISHEACSLAGTLKLGKLVVFYDDNGISIDGQVNAWFTDNTPQRFAAYGWQVIADVDGHNPKAIKEAIQQAQQVSDKPTIICCKTTIAYGSPNLAGSEKAHGAPLGDEEIAATRKRLDWPHAPFDIPQAIRQAWDYREQGTALEREWDTLLQAYKEQYPQQAAELLRRLHKELPADWPSQIQAYIQQCDEQAANLATRKASQQALSTLVELLPEMVGGSADLSCSNLTFVAASQAFTSEHNDANYIYYGVREFAMAAIMNGIAVHGGFIPYGGTFLVFSDYARNAIRLSALMKQRVIYVLTHDSIGLGEDGPTHQPIEHAAMLRMTPNMSVWRPCDSVETAVAWEQAIERLDGPTSLLLSRQTLPHQVRSAAGLANIERGAYILTDDQDTPEAIIIATGSEVAIAMEAYQQLTQQGRRIRVVSMPSCDAFLKQDEAYREAVLPASVTRRVAIEAASSAYWYQFVGLNGKIIGLDTFGESAPGNEVLTALGITTENLVNAVNDLF